MESTPKLLILKRQTIANLGAIKAALDTLAVGSGTTAVASPLSSLIADTKIALILPIVASCISVLSLLARVVVAHYMNVAIIGNPINLTQNVTVTQPEPIEPKPDVMPITYPNIDALEKQ